MFFSVCAQHHGSVIIASKKSEELPKTLGVLSLIVVCVNISGSERAHSAGSNVASVYGSRFGSSRVVFWSVGEEPANTPPFRILFNSYRCATTSWSVIQKPPQHLNGHHMIHVGSWRGSAAAGAATVLVRSVFSRLTYSTATPGTITNS